MWARKSILVFVAPALVIAAIARGSDWPQFLGPTRNGRSSETNLCETWPKEGAPRVWQKKIGQGFSGPAVVSGKLILFHRLGDRETVECLDTKTSKQLWSFDYPTTYRDDFGFDEGPRATPSIADGRVYTYGAEGRLLCLNLETGKKVWEVDAKSRFHASKGFFGIACSPLVEGNLVLLNIGGSENAGIVAFDKVTGSVVWQATSEAASYSSPIAATINGKRQVLFLTRNGLVAVEPQKGKVLFDFPWRPPMNASVSAAVPLAIDDLVFISASYGTGAAALRVKDDKPEKLWSADDVLSNHYATCVHHDGFLYGFDGRQERGCNLRCVDLKTGKIRWSQDRFGAGTITLVGDQLLILSERGELMRATANPTEFKPSARAQILSGTVRAYPALADGFLFARNTDTLICVDLRKSKSQ
jgi:outer membrane protein assembly factor BamB